MPEQYVVILCQHGSAAGKLVDQLRWIWADLAAMLQLQLLTSFLLTAAWQILAAAHGRR